MGHPDPGKFVNFLRNNKASEEVVKDFLDILCEFMRHLC